MQQKLGEGASKSLLQQLKEKNAAAAALCLKVGRRSCKGLREARNVFRDHDEYRNILPQPTWRPRDAGQADPGAASARDAGALSAPSPR